jgi:protein-disulfide isomerase
MSEAAADLRSAPVPPLREDDHVRGPDSAPLVLFYADFTCPRCALVAHRLREAGDLRVVFRHLALRARHRRAVPLAHAAEAAARQGAFWALHDSLYADQGRLDDPHLWERCEELGLDVERFEADRRDDAIAVRVTRDVRDALRAGATSTPTIWAHGSDGVIATMRRFGIREVRRLGPPTEGRARKGSSYEQ